MEQRAADSLAALRRILRATEEGTRALARATALSAPQLLVLQMIDEAGEMSPGALAQQMGIAPATATALVEKLVQRGLVSRRKGEADRRRFWVSLTEAGADALHAAPDPLHERFADRFAALPGWEQAMIVAALERVANLVEAERAAPPARPARVGRAGRAAPILHVSDHVADALSIEGGAREPETH